MTALTRQAGHPGGVADLRRLAQHLRVLVVSPHLDDAIFSVGATIDTLTRAGADVTVVTLFAGDPHTRAPLAAAARRSGFSTSTEATLVRRREDEAACGHLGATAAWGDFPGGDECATPTWELVRFLRPHLVDKDIVLTPGFPLLHEDHRRTSAAVTQLQHDGPLFAPYVEQPYATWQLVNRRRVAGVIFARTGTAPSVPTPLPDGPWLRTRPGVRSYRNKVAAMGFYRSQLPILRRLPRARIITHELLVGGERVAWPSVLGLHTATPHQRG